MGLFLCIRLSIKRSAAVLCVAVIAVMKEKYGGQCRVFTKGVQI